MARILSYPERVSSHNIEKLRQCVRNGPSKYPGAVKVRYPDGSARCITLASFYFYPYFDIQNRFFANDVGLLFNFTGS